MKRYLLLFSIFVLPLCVYSQDYLRLMTYNVHIAKGLDEKRDVQRIANIILEAAPDVVAVQEVDSMTPRNFSHQLGELAMRTRMHAIFAPAIHTGIGRYGIGVLSRERPLKVKRIALPGREEKRRLLIAEFKDYIFCCSHLSLNHEDRMSSLAIMNRYAVQSEKPFFVAGDFNALPNSEFINSLSVDYEVLNDVNEYTFPADNPDRTIDYIVSGKPTAGNAAVAKSQVMDEPMASDHRPVVVTLRRAVAPEKILSSEPFVQYAADGSTLVSWVTEVSANSWVEYFVGDDTCQKSVTAYPLYHDGTVHRAEIVGVAQGEPLRYRICSQETWGEGRVGHTAKSDYYTLTVPVR